MRGDDPNIQKVARDYFERSLHARGWSLGLCLSKSSLEAFPARRHAQACGVARGTISPAPGGLAAQVGRFLHTGQP